MPWPFVVPKLFESFFWAGPNSLDIFFFEISLKHINGSSYSSSSKMTRLEFLNPSLEQFLNPSRIFVFKTFLYLEVSCWTFTELSTGIPSFLSQVLFSHDENCSYYHLSELHSYFKRDSIVTVCNLWLNLIGQFDPIAHEFRRPCVSIV